MESLNLRIAGMESRKEFVLMKADWKIGQASMPTTPRPIKYTTRKR